MKVILYNNLIIRILYILINCVLKQCINCQTPIQKKLHHHTRVAPIVFGYQFFVLNL